MSFPLSELSKRLEDAAASGDSDRGTSELMAAAARQNDLQKDMLAILMRHSCEDFRANVTDPECDECRNWLMQKRAEDDRRP